MSELSAAKVQLELFTQGLKDKTDLAEELKTNLDMMSSRDRRTEDLEKIVRSTILTENDWIQFRLLFEKVYPDYLEQIKNKYPNITPAETRLMALEKLNIRTQEMANMLGISKNAINQTRLRLRRKTGSQSEDVTEELPGV